MCEPEDRFREFYASYEKTGPNSPGVDAQLRAAKREFQRVLAKEKRADAKQKKKMIGFTNKTDTQDEIEVAIEKEPIPLSLTNAYYTEKDELNDWLDGLDRDTVIHISPPVAITKSRVPKYKNAIFFKIDTLSVNKIVRVSPFDYYRESYDFPCSDLNDVIQMFPKVYIRVCEILDKLYHEEKGGKKIEKKHASNEELLEYFNAFGMPFNNEWDAASG